MSIFKRFADWLKKSMDEGLLDEIKRKIKDFRQVEIFKKRWEEFPSEIVMHC